jgi:hypothetical protein
VTGRKLSPEEYYTLGHDLEVESRRSKAKLRERYREWARQLDCSQGHLWRVLSHYRLFCVALGLGAEVFQIPIRRLDVLRKYIDWDHRERRIRAGLNGKLSETEAKRVVKSMLRENNGHQ